MSNLIQALVIAKNTSQKDFEKLYDMIKDRYLEDADLSNYDIDELTSSLKQLDIEVKITKVTGISVTHQGVDKKLFPLPEYGWDGGSPIFTEEFNLKTLDNSDIGGGPTASIVTPKNVNYPGFAMHYAPEESFGEIHIFM